MSDFNFSQAFSALKYRNYRLWFYGQMASLVGTFMQATAQGFLIFQLTKSPAYLGYVGLANGIPSWFFMLYAGVISDRMSRRRLLMIAQFYMMVLALILAFLTLTGIVEAWHILVLAFLLGIGQAFDAPARHSFVLEMVSREDLTNAIALNSTMFNSATMLGPAVGGIIYAITGPGWCFLINSISFLAVIIALSKMNISNDIIKRAKSKVFDDFIEGIRYIKSHKTIRLLIGVTWIVSLFGMSYVTLMPAWAVNVLGGNALTHGWLQSARGGGALIAALVIAMMGRIKYKGKLISIASLLMPCLMIVFSFESSTPLAILTIIGLGWSIMFIFNLVNASIQSLVKDELRGRVMSVYSLVFFGSMPVGGILAGTLAENTSEPITVLINGAIVLVLMLFIWIYRPELRTQA